MTYQHSTTEQPKLNIKGIQIVQFLNILMMKTEFRATLVKIHCHNNSIINLPSDGMKDLLKNVLNIHGLGEHMHAVLPIIPLSSSQFMIQIHSFNGFYQNWRT